MDTKNVSIQIKEVWHNSIEDVAEAITQGDGEMEELLRGLLSEQDGDCAHQLEFTTCGTIQEGSDGIFLTYEESELTGMKGSVTQFFISNTGSVMMQRSGESPLNLVFERGKKYICPNGGDDLLITTRRISNTISGVGGSLDIYYTISVGGVETEYNEFNINVLHE